MSSPRPLESDSDLEGRVDALGPMTGHSTRPRGLSVRCGGECTGRADFEVFEDCSDARLTKRGGRAGHRVQAKRVQASLQEAKLGLRAAASRHGGKVAGGLFLAVFLATLAGCGVAEPPIGGVGVLGAWGTPSGQQCAASKVLPSAIWQQVVPLKTQGPPPPSPWSVNRLFGRHFLSRAGDKQPY